MNILCKIFLFLYSIILILFNNSCKLFWPDDEPEEPITQRIAFLRDRNPDNALYNDNDLWIMDIDGSNQTQLTFGIDNIDDFVFSPSGDKICFTTFSNNTYSKSDVLIINTDGTELINLTNGDGYNHSPFFSDDEKFIVYTSASDRYNNDDLDIFFMKIDGKSKTNITNTDTIHEGALLSIPNTDNILISAVAVSFPEPDIDNHLYTINFEGGNKTCITCQYPDLQPRLVRITNNGNSIIFMGAPTWNGSENRVPFYSMDLDGSNLKQIWEGHIWGTYLDIIHAPNNEYMIIIYYKSYDDIDCYKVDIDGSNTVNITETTGITHIKDISHDGELMFYDKVIDNRTEIYSCNKYGENQQRLTTLGGTNPKISPITNT